MTTTTGTLILIPLTDEEEAEQIHEILERIVVKRRASNILYLENVGPSALELHQRKLEAAAKRKAEMEATRARGEGNFAQKGETLARGVESSRVEIRPSQTPVQQRT